MIILCLSTRDRYIHCVPKNVMALSGYNYESILIIFGTNVTEKVASQKVFYFLTLPN